MGIGVGVATGVGDSVIVGVGMFVNVGIGVDGEVGWPWQAATRAYSKAIEKAIHGFLTNLVTVPCQACRTALREPRRQT